MRFYDREAELKILQDMRLQSSHKARMTFIVGRRRVGKTRLIKEAFSSENLVYFFVAKKNENLLCEEYCSIIHESLGAKIIGQISSFSQIFEYLLEYSCNHPFTLAIDEFQEFITVNPAVYSEIQHLWDTYKERSKMNLVLCGSVYSLMKKIFENSKEPLYGRADRKIVLKPLGTNILKQIMSDHYPDYSNRDLLCFFMLTGGIARYIELLVEQNALSLDSMIRAVLDEHSFFLYEGRDVLIDEFGKDHATYFSILSLIAGSRTARPEMESLLGKNIGGHLERMEKDYGIIHKVRPLFAKPGSRNQKYAIDDNFLNFWFRFIFKNLSAVEMGNLDYVLNVVQRDLDTFSGAFLEKYFIQEMKLSGKFNRIGPSWERKNKNEIDIVAVNDMDKKLVMAEVKLNKKHINLNVLRRKAVNILASHQQYTAEFKGLSLNDMCPAP